MMCFFLTAPLHACKADIDCDARAKCLDRKCICQGNTTGNGKYCRGKHLLFQDTELVHSCRRMGVVSIKANLHSSQFLEGHTKVRSCFCFLWRLS